MPTNRPVIRSSRYTADEWATVETAAAQAGLSPSAYVRQSALGARIRQRRGHANDQTVKALARIGNNINQLARAANADGTKRLERDARAALVDLLAVIDKL
jgi:hypothetical protein